MTESSITPFPFEKLKKYTDKQAELFTHLSHLLPFELEGDNSILDVLKKYFGKQFTLRFESVFDAPYEKFIAGLPERFVAFVIGLTPSAKKVMIELDPDFALALVDKLLGGSGEVPQEFRPITSLQEGALKFVVVRILKELSDKLPQSPFSFRLDKVLSQATDLARQEDQGEWVILLTLRIKMGEVSGYIRLCFPHPLLSELAGPAFQNLKDFEENSVFSKKLERMEAVRIPAWAEVARVSLLNNELAELRKGDIILFDETYSDFDGKNLSGNVHLRIGDEGLGVVEGKLVASQETLKIILENTSI